MFSLINYLNIEEEEEYLHRRWVKWDNLHELESSYLQHVSKNTTVIQNKKFLKQKSTHKKKLLIKRKPDKLSVKTNKYKS